MDKYQHGGDIYSHKIAYDFSANINPLGMPEKAKQVLQQSSEPYEHYPDCRCRELVKAIVRFENTDRTYVLDSDVVCGNGAADLIYRLISVISPRQALLPVPSFSEYEKALRAAGCAIQYHQLSEKKEFMITEELLAEIQEETELLFLCNPNNPTGCMIEDNLLDRIVRKCEEKSVWLIVDECFLDFTGQGDASAKKHLEKHKKLIIIRAFTKIFALAGLRLGYMLSKNQELCQKVFDYGQCWSVSVPAQLAGAAALEETGYIQKTVQYVRRERMFLHGELQRLGCRVYPGAANFLLFQWVPDLDQWLREQQIAIRSCENYYGLSKGYFRIAVRTHKENKYLIHTMERLQRQSCGPLGSLLAEIKGENIWRE